jgi:hypothetical protein
MWRPACPRRRLPGSPWRRQRSARTPRLSSYWLTLVTPVQSRVARALIEGLKNPTVARDDRLRHLVPLGLTGFDIAARAALDEREARRTAP